MKKQLLLLITILTSNLIFSQAIFNAYQQEMDVAYQMYPSVPKGILESWSFTTTHFSHLEESTQESCSGLPKAYSVMGLTEDGQGYFRNNLVNISNLSGYSIADIKQSPQTAILAFAATYDLLLTDFNITSSNPKDHIEVLEALAEIPLDHNPVNNFALNSHIYSVLSFVAKPVNQAYYDFPSYQIDLAQVFGATNYAVLSSTSIDVTNISVTNGQGTNYAPLQLKSTEYPPAIWNAAPSCNYSSSSGTAVSAITIHTIQGSYAGAISWSQNCSSNVSYHYVVRSSDGQVTQMVLEADKGWHVGSENPYTIGIEHEGYVSDPSWYTAALYNGSAGICKDVVISGYGINPLRTYYGASGSSVNVLGGCTKIKGHQHFPVGTHTDPGINWDWPRFYHLINDNPAISPLTTASGTLYDTGGPTGTYTEDERELYLIQPAGATNVTITFNAFDIEANWDYMFVYDGATTSSPLIGTYTGTTNPGTLTSNGGSMLIEFRSDCATNNPGWEIVWNSTNGGGGGTSDVTAPIATVSTPNNWKTQDFTATFTDADETGGSGLDKKLYQVIDFDGSDWRANDNNGFFSDNFDQTGIHSEWTNASGTWTLVGGYLDQSDEANANTNIYADLNQNTHNEWFFQYAMKIDGGAANVNKRAGFHFMCDDATLSNRGNSYFVWFRTDNNKIQIYKVVNDVFSLELDQPFTLNDNQWYDVKIAYSKTSGDIDVWVDNAIGATWNDPAPYTVGNAISFRSGESLYQVNNLKAYHEHAATELITVGSNADIRYQNTNSTTPSGRVKSIAIDVAKNVSSIASQDINVDWTTPTLPSSLNDGTAADIDNQTNNTQLSANWTASTDSHSDIERYWYAIGSTVGATDVVNWTDNWFNTSFTHTGLSLNFGSTYYVTVKTENGAGLISTEVTSDGVTIDSPTNPPVAGFTVFNSSICAGDSILLSNSSSDATTYAWTIDNGATLSSNTAASPYAYINTTGTYNIELTAIGPGGSDVSTQSIFVTVDQAPVAAATPSLFTVEVNNIVTFTNQSTNANGYTWDFGDGNSSTDANPWNTYTSVGTYTVELTAINGNCPDDVTTITIEVINSSSIDEIEGLSKVSILPNPNNGQFELVLWADKSMDLDVAIFDINGKRIGNIFNQTINKGKLNITVDESKINLSSGVYFVNIQSEKGVFNQRVIIQKD
jgi:PKD repeat protein/N-acetyl-anhydromuramyl-L-alanine amidase AmpD